MTMVRKFPFLVGWVEEHGMTRSRLGWMRYREMLDHYAVVPA